MAGPCARSGGRAPSGASSDVTYSVGTQHKLLTVFQEKIKTELAGWKVPTHFACFFSSISLSSVSFPSQPSQQSQHTLVRTNVTKTSQNGNCSGTGLHYTLFLGKKMLTWHAGGYYTTTTSYKPRSSQSSSGRKPPHSTPPDSKVSPHCLMYTSSSSWMVHTISDRGREQQLSA